MISERQFLSETILISNYPHLKSYRTVYISTNECFYVYSFMLSFIFVRKSNQYFNTFKLNNFNRKGQNSCCVLFELKQKRSQFYLGYIKKEKASALDRRKWYMKIEFTASLYVTRKRLDMLF